MRARDYGIKVWGHAGNIAGYRSLIAKAVAGPAVSITLTQAPPKTDSLADEPRAEVAERGLLP